VFPCFLDCFVETRRNAYLRSSELLRVTLQKRALPRVLFVGRISGMEGHTKAIATVTIAGMNAASLARD
jgi:folate-dependent tRNA-U54 methylase TrmFO/GidA